MTDHTYISRIKDGKLQKNVQEEFDSDLKDFEGQQVILKLAKKRKNRSLEQNKYYFHIICNAFIEGVKDKWGHEIGKEEAHNNLKKECNFEELIGEDTGEIFRLVKSTANLDTLKFEEYLDRCRKFIWEWFGVHVALPNEQMEIEV
jgi:hypothetical protein